MPTLKEQVENRAKELHNIYYPYFWETQTEEHKKKWIKVAKHCIAAELRSRIDEVELIAIKNGRNTNVNIRMKELQDQLSALENL